MISKIILVLFAMSNVLYSAGGMINLHVVDNNVGGKNRYVFDLSERDMISYSCFNELLEENHGDITIARVYHQGEGLLNFHDYEQGELFSWFFEQMRKGDPFTDVNTGQFVKVIDIHRVLHGSTKAPLVKSYTLSSDEGKFKADLFHHSGASMLECAMREWMESNPFFIPVYFSIHKHFFQACDLVWLMADDYVQSGVVAYDD